MRVDFDYWRSVIYMMLIIGGFLVSVIMIVTSGHPMGGTICLNNV